MTALPNAMTTRNRFLTTVKALERALRQAESVRPATDPAPFFFPFALYSIPRPPAGVDGGNPPRGWSGVKEGIHRFRHDHLVFLRAF